MASQEERDNFFSLSLLLFRVGNQRLREYFKAQWPIVYQRVKPGTVPPPWQDTPHDATEMNKIQPTKLKFKFKDEKTKFNSGNTNDWDFSLLTSVLRFSSLNFVLPSSPESKALDDLKAIRNKLTGHPTDAAIPNAVFNPAWTDACNALKLFNATAADFKSVQDDVKKPLDVLYPMLQECVAQEIDIQLAVNTLINRLEQLQQTVEQQHTTLQQTVEQQHMTLQQTVEQQHMTLQQTVEQQGRIEKKVDQLSDQVNQAQKRSSAEAQPGEDVKTKIPRTASETTERNYAEDSEKLKEAIKSNTEYQTKFMAAHDITSEKTDQIFTSLTVYYADKKQVKKEQAEGLSRSKLLREYTKRETGVKVKEYQDIFIGMKGENPNLLLTGKPGIGKTFFCEKVIRDWSLNRLFQNEENVENNHKIQFAYLLKFRQLSSQDKVNLQELLNCSPLLDDNSVIDDSLFEYLIKNPSEVLIILDGFDEYSQQHREEIASDFEQKYPNNSRAKMPIPALCSKLIKGKLLKNSVVLVSSRPGEAEELGEIHFDRYVEISGFSPEQVSEYVDKYFSEPEKQQAKIAVGKHIKTNENLVSFCHIPLLSFLLCWCLEWRISQSGITENLPTKLTDIYDEVVKVVVNKLHANLKYSKMSENARKIAQDTLDKLSKLASNLLKHNKYIFDEEDMKNEFTEEEIENLKVSGILHCIPPIRISAFESKSEYTFIHLTLQEYLSASFFVKNKEIPEKKKATGQTLVFMSGFLSGKKDVKLMDELIRQITPQHVNDDVNKLQLLQCLYEYGDDGLTQLTINNLYDKYCNSEYGMFVFAGVSDVDVNCLSYFLDIIRSLTQQHPQLSPGRVLSIGGSSLTSFGVGVVCDSLVRNSFITGLGLYDCSLDDKCVEKITNLLVKTEITILYLSYNNFTDKQAESICRVIIQPDCHVELLDLMYNENITEDCKKTLTQLVQKHKPNVIFDI